MSNDFKTFATSGTANVYTNAEYVADTDQLNGNQPGIAKSKLVNKAVRQSSIMSNVLAQYIEDKTGENIVDDGTTATILANLKAATTAEKKLWQNQAVTITPPTDADKTLTATENGYGRLVLVNGAWTTAHNIIVDNTERSFLVDNSAGTYTATVKTSAGSGIAVTAGTKVWLLCDGTNVIESINTSIFSGFKNLIINGNPIINQRAYISATATTSANQYTLDRWRVVTSGQSLTFSTTANVTTMTLPFGGIEQVIEGLNFQSGTYTISFVATGDTVCAVNGITKASGGTFTLTGGTNATVKFSSVSGTGTVKLIQVEKGSVATPFEQRPYGLELSLCQRYYETSDDIYIQKANGTGTTSGNQAINDSITFKVSKRVVPTTAVFNFTTLAVNEIRDLASGAAVGATSIGTVSTIRVTNTTAPIDNRSHGFIWTASAEL